MSDFNVTLAAIRAAKPCREGWTKLVKHVGDMADDAPLPLLTILESNGLDDTLWVVDNVGGQAMHDKLKPFLDACALRACDHAERVLPRFEQRYPNDKRPRKAIEAARGRVAGTVSQKKCCAAAASGRVAAYADAANAAHAAAYAASAAAYAAHAAAAAYAAADAAAYAAHAAANAANAAKIYGAEREWQAEELRRILTTRAKGE